MSLTKPTEMDLRIIKRLETVYDPEIAIDVFNLGLIRRLEAAKANDPSSDVNLDLIFTSLTCPMADEIKAKVEKAISDGMDDYNRSLPVAVRAKRLGQVKINVLMETLTQEMMPEHTRMMLGL